MMPTLRAALAVIVHAGCKRFTAFVFAAALLSSGTTASLACDVALVSVIGVDFGTYSPSRATQTSGEIALSCTDLFGQEISLELRLSPGLNAKPPQRELRNSEHDADLAYNLYADPSRQLIWGDGTNGTVTVQDTFVLNLPTTVRTYTIYGQIPASQNVPAGTYSDTIVVTVFF